MCGRRNRNHGRWPSPPARRTVRNVRRAGGVPIELLLVLPLVILFLLVVIQLGMLLANWQHVKEAAFAGARAAADLTVPQLRGEESILDSSSVPHNANEVVKERVDRTLAAAGLAPSGAVVLEYLAPSGDPSGPVPPGERFGTVRVTVVVDSANLAPNVLGFFGVSLVERRTRTEIVCPHLNAAS
ncbi:MAG: TadE/TadG family type IV pilus assembly protein [Planctomycetales bacterium]